MASYEERLLLPLDGLPEIEFYTKSGTLLARGYERVVIGKRGPYVEFADASIIRDVISIPLDQAWRLDERYDYVFYNEWRTNDDSAIKLYEQRKAVVYADYRVGYWYVSPFDLTSKEFPTLIKPIDKKKA